jgi:hypothetical protein
MDTNCALCEAKTEIMFVHKYIVEINANRPMVELFHSNTPDFFDLQLY